MKARERLGISAALKELMDMHQILWYADVKMEGERPREPLWLPRTTRRSTSYGGTAATLRVNIDVM